jgi:hypothetical protein
VDGALVLAPWRPLVAGVELPRPLRGVDWASGVWQGRGRYLISELSIRTLKAALPLIGRWSSER